MSDLPAHPFPAGFLWGTATAAHQVEGDNRNNQWWAWEQTPGHIYQNQRSGLACNWWAPGGAEADFERAQALGQNAHRLSVEWSRLEPSDGVFVIEGARERLVSRLSMDVTQADYALGYGFDIVLRGPTETPAETRR